MPYLRRDARNQHEHLAQAQVIEWADLSHARYPELRWLYAVPNGGQRHPAVAAKLKAEGVRRGVPDLVLPVPRGTFHGAYIEMKREKGGTVSPEQREWRDYLQGAGYAHCIAQGFEAARTFITNYLECRSLEPTP